MTTKDVPRAEWVQWLDKFSKQHENWIVELEVVGRQLGDQEESSKLPLVGISADVKAGQSRVVVTLGGRADAHLDRIIDKAKRVWVEETDDPRHDAVAIEAEDGTTTIVHFRHIDPSQKDRLLPGNAPGNR